MASHDDEISSALRNNPDAISNLMKSASHRGRVSAMALLLTGEKGLSDLVEGTGLSKNAMVNHLSILMGSGLVRREERGTYALTADGRDLITSAATLYLNSELRAEEERRRAQRLYAGGRGGRGLEERMVSNGAVYQPCWISYTGAVAGALRSLGSSCDVVDVGGHSGYAFIVNVIRGEFCPSGPTAFHPETWGEIHEGTQSLGWSIESWSDEGSYPEGEEPGPQELERARRLHALVRAEIMEDRPAVVWGLYIPEYGIVNGVRGSSYIVSTFKRLTGQPEEPIPYFDLRAPGCLDALFFKAPIRVDASEADRKAIERAVRFARGSTPALERYANGPGAWDEWADVLENRAEEGLYNGNSYAAACYHEARAVAAEFLGRVAKRQDRPQSEHLLKAAESYREIEGLMKRFTELFPFAMEGDMITGKRREGAALLREVKPLDEVAADHLERALEAWESP
jgi:DNA-binding transcriptional ArsR family regulator